MVWKFERAGFSEQSGRRSRELNEYLTTGSPVARTTRPRPREPNGWDAELFAVGATTWRSNPTTGLKGC